MATKKKSRKMDPKLIAVKVKHEVDYINKKFKVPKSLIRQGIKEVGRSRAKVYMYLRGKGHPMKTRKYKG